MSALQTSTLNLGRHTPQTTGQRESARAGIAACNADWRDKALTTHDDMLRQGRDKFWQAGYEIRWLELVPTLTTHDDVADLARWEADGGAS
jgi:hypothetical protein